MSLSNHTFILKNDGTLWGCGQNGSGQLGLGDKNNRNTFTQITTNINNVKSVYSGGNYTIILKSDNTLWGCGENSYSQLGLGDLANNQTTTFTQITDTYDIKSVYCGFYHTIILKNDDTLLGCGYNTNGQLGLGDKTDRTSFTQITANTDNVKSIHCGGNYTIILKNDYTLWGSGYNSVGQLGLKDTNDKTTFMITDTNPGNIKSICCGCNHTIILKNDSTLWVCGYNSNGQLGLGDTNNRTTFTQIIDTYDVKSVYCGYAHTIILKNDGTLWGCGNNRYGQLGLGDNANRTTLTQITDNVKSAYCGYNHTFILKKDNTLWGCGDNQYGQLGLGDNYQRTTFTQVATNADGIKSFANNYSNISNIIKIYDTEIGHIETLDTNNFRNISVNKFEKIKALCVNPDSTYLNCLISFDKKQTWKTFNGTNWITISDITPQNIILNGTQLKILDKLDKNKLISGGFTGDLDFKIAMKTNDENKTPSVTKIYIEYK